MAGRAICGLALLSFSVLTADPHQSIARKDFIYFCSLDIYGFCLLLLIRLTHGISVNLHLHRWKVKDREHHKHTRQCTVTIVFPRASMSLWWETRTLKITYCFLLRQLQAKLMGIWLTLSVPEMCQCLVINNLSYFQVPSLI